MPILIKNDRSNVDGASGFANPSALQSEFLIYNRKHLLQKNIRKKIHEIHNDFTKEKEIDFNSPSGIKKINELFKIFYIHEYTKQDKEAACLVQQNKEYGLFKAKEKFYQEKYKTLPVLFFIGAFTSFIFMKKKSLSIIMCSTIGIFTFYKTMQYRQHKINFHAKAIDLYDVIVGQEQRVHCNQRNQSIKKVQNYMKKNNIEN